MKEIILAAACAVIGFIVFITMMGLIGIADGDYGNSSSRFVIWAVGLLK